MNVRGGKRTGAGRKSKADEEKANEVIMSALKSIYGSNEEEVKKKLVDSLLTTQRGTLFIAEHVFGKPKETIDNTIRLKNFNLKDALEFE